ncbi:MAG: Zn-ribbon domain-containing OB-fold protein [Steroidobacteraceae bacterium]
MSEAPRKHLPQITPETAEYWAGCKRHELLIQRCADCGAAQFYPRAFCTHCSGSKVRWVRASGRGTLASYTIVHRAVSQAYAAEVPYVVALVSLEEGPMMMSNVIGCSPGDLRVGMSLQVVFDDWSESITVPKFHPG